MSSEDIYDEEDVYDEDGYDGDGLYNDDIFDVDFNGSSGSDEETSLAAAAKRRRIDQQYLGSGDGEDRISALPDPIIAHILSLLPSTKEAIRTGVLSKRWRFLWTSVTSLSFSRTKLISSIAETLFQCSNPNLKKFKLDISCNRGISPYLNKWVRFAINRNVEELYIRLKGTFGGYDLVYELPEYLFINSVFTSLTLRGRFLFMPNGSITWELLTNLRIDGTELSNDVIENILLGSPVLETLVLGGCYGFNRLDIDSPRMRKFVLNGYDGGKTTVLEITAPYVMSLEIKGGLKLKDIVLLDVHSLLGASFSFYFCESFKARNDSEVEVTWKRILQSVKDVNELSLGGRCLQVLGIEGAHLQSALLKCKCLKTEFVGREDLLGLMNLLQILPDLESLIILENLHANRCPDSLAIDNHFTCKENAFVCLKTVKIAYSEEWALDLVGLVQFLVKNARALEEVIFYAGNQLLMNRVARKSGVIVYSPRAAASRRLLQIIKKLLASCQTDKAVIRFEGFDIRV